MSECHQWREHFRIKEATYRQTHSLLAKTLSADLTSSDKSSWSQTHMQHAGVQHEACDHCIVLASRPRCRALVTENACVDQVSHTVLYQYTRESLPGMTKNMA